MRLLSRQDVDEVDDIGEMEDYDMMDEEQSLSRSVSQMTTRGEATQPDEDIENVSITTIQLASSEIDLMMMIG